MNGETIIRVQTHDFSVSDEYALLANEKKLIQEKNINNKNKIIFLIITIERVQHEKINYIF